MAVFTKKVSVGKWAKKGEDFKDKDILVIASEGQQIQGTYGVQNVFLVKCLNGNEGNLSFNQTSINNMIDAFGEDSLQWVGKKAKVWLIMQSVQGKMQRVPYLTHPDAEIVEDGAGFRWEIPGRQTEPVTPPKKPNRSTAEPLPSKEEYPENDGGPIDF